jgi:hypothetical protein
VTAERLRLLQIDTRSAAGRLVLNVHRSREDLQRLLRWVDPVLLTVDGPDTVCHMKWLRVRMGRGFTQISC